MWAYCWHYRWELWNITDTNASTLVTTWLQHTETVQCTCISFFYPMATTPPTNLTQRSSPHSCCHWQSDRQGALQLPHAPHTDTLSDLPLLRFKGLRSQNSCSAHLHWHCRVTHYSGGSGGFLVATWTHTKGLWVTLPVWCRGPVIWRWVGGHR